MSYNKKPQKTRTKLNEYVDDNDIATIKSIAELQRKDFSAIYTEALKYGIAALRNNFNLTNREMKVRTLDIMYSQAYPYLYKTYEMGGLEVSLVDKFCTFWVFMKAHSVQTNFEENKHFINMQCRNIIKYLALNFKEDFETIKTIIFNMPRQVESIELFKLDGKTQSTLHILNDKDAENIESTTTGKYKKDDGSFGDCKIDFPDKEQMIEKHNLKGNYNEH